MPIRPGNKEAVRSPGTRTEEVEGEGGGGGGGGGGEVEAEKDPLRLCRRWCEGLPSPLRRANSETSPSVKVLEVVRRSLVGLVWFGFG